jgi:general secretion pathway protein G
MVNFLVTRRHLRHLQSVDIRATRVDNLTLVKRAFRQRSLGMTLVEIMIALAIVGILSAVSVQLYDEYRERVMMAQVRSDMMNIGVAIARFQLNNGGVLPPDLAAIGMNGLLDPWGNPYGYQSLTPPVANPSMVRKNKNLVPINSDYDLYSMGPDGQSKGPLTAQASRDDIVRANNGRFVGLASDY